MDRRRLFILLPWEERPVLDRYFDDITFEKVRSEKEWWNMIGKQATVSSKRKIILNS